MRINKIELKRGYFNEEIAELIGIIYGDGNLFIDKKNGYRINITGNKETDYNYLTSYVSKLFYRNFDIKPKIWIYKYRKAVALNIFSKKLMEYLLSLGLKDGPKKELEIPSIILSRKKYKARFLRGVLDTDFWFGFEKKRDYSYPKLCTMFCDFNFTRQLEKLFLDFGINCYLYNKKTKLDNKIYLQYGVFINS